jgi:hypothetical protein
MDDRRDSRSPPRRGAFEGSVRSIGAYAPGSGKAPAGGAGWHVFAVFAVLALLAGCARTPPEEALRATIDTMRAAAEARDADALAAHVAEDFAGPGGMDRDRFRRTAALLWLRSRTVGVTLGPLDVDVRGEHATVRFTAMTRGGEGLLPDEAQVYEVDTAWRLEGGDWRLISARWEPGV